MLGLERPGKQLGSLVPEEVVRHVKPHDIPVHDERFCQMHHPLIREAGADQPQTRATAVRLQRVEDLAPLLLCEDVEGQVEVCQLVVAEFRRYVSCRAAQGLVADPHKSCYEPHHERVERNGQNGEEHCAKSSQAEGLLAQEPEEHLAQEPEEHHRRNGRRKTELGLGPLRQSGGKKVNIWASIRIAFQGILGNKIFQLYA